MRLNAAFTSALVSSATLMGYAHAEEAEQKPDVSSVAEKPTFTVCPASVAPLSSLVSAIPKLANLLSLAHHPPSAFPRAIHRGLGIQMDSLPGQKGRLQVGGRLDLCWSLGR